MKILRICRLPTVICILAASASWRDCTADADSISQKWVTPTTSAAKKNPIAPTQDSIVAGQKMYLKHCTTCHGQNGGGDGRLSPILVFNHPGSAILAFVPSLTVRFFGKSQLEKNRCRDTGGGSPRLIGGI